MSDIVQAPPDAAVPKHEYVLPVPEESNYIPQYGVLLVVADEREQMAAFANIKALGYDQVKVLTI